MSFDHKPRPEKGRKSRRKKSAPGPWYKNIPLGWLLLLISLAAVVIWIFPEREPRSPDAPATPNTLTQAHSTPETDSADSDVTHPEFDPSEFQSDHEKAVKLAEQANQLLNEQKDLEAIELYRQSLLLDSESEDTHYNLGFALARLGRNDEAIAHYREALRILPDYAEAHNNLGNLLVKKGDFAQAVEHFAAALEFNPDSASAHNNLGNALARQGKLAEAVVHFSKAAHLSPSYWEAQYNLGTAYMNQGRTDEAIQQFAAVLRLNPNFAPAQKALLLAEQKKRRAP